MKAMWPSGGFKLTSWRQGKGEVMMDDKKTYDLLTSIADNAINCVVEAMNETKHKGSWICESRYKTQRCNELPIEKKNNNLLLDTRIYEVKYQDEYKVSLVANKKELCVSLFKLTIWELDTFYLTILWIVAQMEQNFRQAIRVLCSRMRDVVNLILRKDGRIVVHSGKMWRI